MAVKTLKEGSGEEDKVKFLQEAAIMGQFKHSNVVEMHGMILIGEPVSACLNAGPQLYMYHRLTPVDGMGEGALKAYTCRRHG